jgi:hypothetical protein
MDTTALEIQQPDFTPSTSAQLVFFAKTAFARLVQWEIIPAEREILLRELLANLAILVIFVQARYRQQLHPQPQPLNNFAITAASPIQLKAIALTVCTTV